MSLWEVIAVCLALLLLVIVMRKRLHLPDQDAAVEQIGGISTSTDPLESRFSNVFAITSREQREHMLASIMEKHSCDRRAAMMIALDERERDERRFD